MSGASLKHNIIDRNLIYSLANFLKGKDCQALPCHMRVGTPSSDSYMYPGALIVCDKPELEDEMFDTLKNPSVIFEIISPSTALYDKAKILFLPTNPFARGIHNDRFPPNINSVGAQAI